MTSISRMGLFKSVSQIGLISDEAIEDLAKNDNAHNIGRTVANMYSTFISNPSSTKIHQVSRSFFARQTPEALRTFRQGLKNIKKLANKEQTSQIEPTLKFLFNMTKSTGEPSSLKDPVQKESVRWIKLENGNVIKETDLAKQLGVPLNHPSIAMRRAMETIVSVTAKDNTVKELDGTERQIEARL